MMAGVFILGFGIWVLSQQPKTEGETEPRPETVPVEWTEWYEVERIQSVRTKIDPDTYYCIERKDRMQGDNTLSSLWRVQIKGTDNDYTVSTNYTSLEDAQAKVASMNQRPTKEDYDLAEQKGEFDGEKDKETPLGATPTFGVR
tara:strand:- start:6914 stop:7345 length:432 start_codon:yes stop_codon:yes gene_type:complete